MTEIVGLAVRPTDRSVIAPATRRRRRWHQPPRWLWPTSIALQVVSAAVATGYTYFFVDDFIFLQEARTQAFSLSYLRGPLYEHFSPITRLLNKMLLYIAPGSFGFAHSVQLVLYAAALLAFALLMRTILGNSWTAFGLTVAFGQSLFLMRLLNWWTATANILPSTIFLLLAIAGYLRWRPAQSRWWLAVSLFAFAAALADYETAMLFPAYLLLVSLLVLEDKLGPSSWLVVLRRERWAWLGYLTLEAAALYNYFDKYYFQSVHPSAGQLVRYVKFALVDAFVPALVGIKDPQAPLSRHAAVIAAAWLVVGCAVALTLYLRPRAWRCLAAFAVVFAITMVPVGLNRIKQFGVGIGHELYYEQSLHCMFLVLIALAIASSGRRAPPSWLAGMTSAIRGVPGALVLGATLAIAGYCALYVTSVRAMANQSVEPRRTFAYVDTFRASARQVRMATGHYPVLVDHQVPADIIPAIFAPYDHYDNFFPVIEPRVRFDLAGQPVYVVDATGRLVPVRFTPLAMGLLSRTTVSALDGSGVIPAQRPADSSAACVPGRRPDSQLRIPLSSPHTLRPLASGLPYAIRVAVRMPTHMPVIVVLADSHRVVPDQGFPAIWGAGPDNEFVPLTIAMRVNQVDLNLPTGACVSGLSLGEFSVSGPAL